MLKNTLDDLKNLIFFTKQKFKRENPINQDETNCVICGFCLPTAASMYLDFVIAKEHAFIRNIFNHDELKQSKSIKTYEIMNHSENVANCHFVKHKLFR